MKIFSREDHRNTSRFATNARRVHSYIFSLVTKCDANHTSRLDRKMDIILVVYDTHCILK